MLLKKRSEKALDQAGILRVSVWGKNKTDSVYSGSGKKGDTGFREKRNKRQGKRL